MDDNPDGYQVYADLVKEQIDEERARKSSLEQRGVFVLTSSGAVATLLFGLVAVVTDSKSFVLPLAARCPLTVAVIAFALASILGLMTNMPLDYKEPSTESLNDLIRDQASRSESLTDAIAEVAKVRVVSLGAYRTKNDIKARLLMFGFGAEAAGTCFVAWSVYRVLNP